MNKREDITFSQNSGVIFLHLFTDLFCKDFSSLIRINYSYFEGISKHFVTCSLLSWYCNLITKITETPVFVDQLCLEWT